MKRIITIALSIVLVFSCLSIATLCASAEQTELLTGGEWLQGFRTPSASDSTKAAIRTDTNQYNRRAYYSKLMDVTEGQEYTFSFKGRAGDGIKVLQLKSDGTSIVSNTNYWVGRDVTSTSTQFYFKDNKFTATITPASGVTQIGFSLFNQYDSDGSYKSNPLGVTFDYERIKNDISSGTITVSFKGEVTTSEVEPDLSVEANMVSGAAIRLTNVNGLRFYTLFDSAKIAELQALGATVELGTLIAPKDLLGKGDLTFESSKYIDVKYQATDESGAFIWHKDVLGQIAGSIVNIKESNTSYSPENGNVARDFVGRGYAKVTLVDKTVITYANYADSNIANNSRSLAFVAEALKKDTAKFGELGSDAKARVEEWASKLPA